MNMKRKTILVVFLLFLIPSTLLCQEKLKTGYDVYHNIMLIDKAQTPDDALKAVQTLGYLDGCIDGLILMQDLLFDTMFPKEVLSEDQRKKLSKEVNFHRLNIPKEGLAVGQVILVYKKWAEKHPEKLNGTARACILESLMEAYGWK